MFKYLFLIAAGICASPVDIEAEEQFLFDMKLFAITVDQDNARLPVASGPAQRSAELLHQLINTHERVVSLARDLNTVRTELSIIEEKNLQLPMRIQTIIRLLQEIVDSSTPSSLAAIEPMKGRELAHVIRGCLTGTDDEIEKLKMGEKGLLMPKRIVTSIRRLPNVTWTGLKRKIKSFVEEAGKSLEAEIALLISSKNEQLGLIHFELETAQWERQIANTQYGESLAQLNSSLEQISM